MGSVDRVNMESCPLRSVATGSTLIVLLTLTVSCQVAAQTLVEQDFAPAVTATCKAGHMTIKVNTNSSFYGAIHARDFRTPACISYGNGSRLTTLDVNLLASPATHDYCGVIVNNKTEEERSIPVAVRIHRTLELADDKFYVITCGRAGFKNARNETSLVSLKVLEKGRKLQEVTYGRAYTLRADISKPDETYGIRVKSCFAFNKGNTSVQLINDKGCPVNGKVISAFKYDEKQGTADATLFSMFRFSEGPDVHFQCDIAICKGLCPETRCDESSSGVAQARAQPNNIYSETTADEGVLMASTTVFVLEPGQSPRIEELCDEGTIRPPWLLYLCIAFGLMFLIMLVINIFLCSAMTCSCARTEVIEKEPSIIEDYDPYRSWHGSQYGSRYSLNGKPGYVSGGSTMNSTRSISTNSDHYAIVHSRPGSRYSPGSKPNQRSPGSNLGSHYSGKM